MEDVDLSYIAGQFDADGAIGLYKPNGLYSIRVSIVLTTQDIETLYWVQSLLGGAIYKAATSWKWNPASRDRERVLRLLLPFLKTKKALAELCIEYFEELARRGQARGFTQEEKDVFRVRTKKLTGRLKEAFYAD